MEKIRAVNLGGWFVLEKWMKPSLFDEYPISKRCETSFVTEHPFAKERLQDHWQTWIQKEDLVWLKEQGINLVRLPIPWWLFPEEFAFPYPYQTPIKYIDQFMDLAEEVGMKVMLDLHTSPGSQNGFDNGGIDGVMTWHLDPNNIEITTQVLEKIALRYYNHPALHSLQLLNEPHREIDLTLIQNFYLDAYKRLRTILLEDTYIVFHDAFRFSEWKPFFENNQFKNVILDTHIYQCFSSYFEEIELEKFLAHPKTYQKSLQEMEELVPVIVGEWSLGAGRKDTVDFREKFEKEYFEAQYQVFQTITGWVFWSYKIENYQSGWNFRSLIERMIIKL